MQWCLEFTDARSVQHEMVSKDVNHFSSSFSVSWSDVSLPPVGELHSCALYALTPLFFENMVGDNVNKISPVPGRCVFGFDSI